MRSSATSCASQAPKLCPATPVKLIRRVSGLSLAWPYFLAISPESIAPTVRFTLRISRSSTIGSPRSSAGAGCGDQVVIERGGKAVVLMLGLEQLAPGGAA